jgi:hypothetical protein
MHTTTTTTISPNDRGQSTEPDQPVCGRNHVVDTDRTRLVRAFALLARKENPDAERYLCRHGYGKTEAEARRNLSTYAEALQLSTERLAFYLKTDSKTCFRSEMLIEALPIYWSGDPMRVIGALRQAGLTTTWDIIPTHPVWVWPPHLLPTT